MPDVRCLPNLAQRLVLAVLLLLYPSASQEEQPGLLRISKDNWNQKVFLDRLTPVREKEAASFTIERDSEYGACLAIGPWRAGKWNAYYQYAGQFPFGRATVRGFYRTDGLRPFEAAVFITYYKSGARIDSHSFSLTPAGNWKPFEVVLRHPPPGTDSFSPGFGLRQKAEGRVLFANISVSAETPAAVFPDDLPPVTRPAPSADFGKRDFFRIEKDSRSIFWLVAPDGRPFYSSGIAGPGFEQNEKGFAQGHQYAGQIREMGFNSLAGWSRLEAWSELNRILEKEGKAPIPIFYAVESNKLKGNFDFLSTPEGNICGGSGHEFPDPFDPRYAEAYQRHIGEIAQTVKDKQWFIGWFADNERDHADLFRCVGSHYAKEAFLSWLNARHGSVKALNAAWLTRYRSMEDVALNLPVPHSRTGRIYEDFRVFAGVIASRFADVTLRAIRTADPGHLVFSQRFMMSDSSEWLQLLEHYSNFDGIAINMYPSNRTPGLSENERLFLQSVYAKAGKPLIISEWSVPAADSGLYSDPDNLDWSFSKVVTDQEERSRQAALVTIEFYNQPYIIGAHWFIWKDFDSRQRKANRGLFRADGQPWAEIQQRLKQAHGRLW